VSLRRHCGPTTARGETDPGRRPGDRAPGRSSPAALQVTHDRTPTAGQGDRRKLDRKSYTQQELDNAKSAVAVQLAAYALGAGVAASIGAASGAPTGAAEPFVDSASQLMKVSLFVP